MVAGAVALLVLLVALVMWHRLAARWRSPQSFAFSATLGAGLFLITGFAGYGLQRGPALLAESRWVHQIIWPQVWLGVAFLVAAVISWRVAIQDVNRRVR